MIGEKNHCALHHVPIVKFWKSRLIVNQPRVTGFPDSEIRILSSDIPTTVCGTLNLVYRVVELWKAVLCLVHQKLFRLPFI